MRTTSTRSVVNPWRPTARIVLCWRTSSYVGDDVDVVTLVISQTELDGHRCERRITFDVDDEDAAYAELDARALALAGDLAGPLGILFISIADLNSRDVDSLAFLIPACYSGSTTPPAGWGEL